MPGPVSSPKNMPSFCNFFDEVVADFDEAIIGAALAGQKVLQGLLTDLVQRAAGGARSPDAVDLLQPVRASD